VSGAARRPRRAGCPVPRALLDRLAVDFGESSSS
jgi:hypothetical protein